jgi:hypothetical protein
LFVFGFLFTPRASTSRFSAPPLAPLRSAGLAAIGLLLTSFATEFCAIVSALTLPVVDLAAVPAFIVCRMRDLIMSSI